jgi:Peptidase A4 family
MRRAILIAIAAVVATAITSNAAASIPRGAAARATSAPATARLGGAIGADVAGPTLHLPPPPADGAVDTNMKPAPPSARTPRYTLQKSPNWDGYINVAAKGIYFNDVTAYWTVPRFSCRNRQLVHGSHAGQWIGIDGFQTLSVEQEGNSVDCIANRRRATITRGTTMWFEMYPLPPESYQDAVLPGDTIGAETKYLGHSEFQLYIKDFTNGQYINTVQPCTQACSLHTTEAIDEIPGRGVRSKFGLTKTSTFTFANYYNAIFDSYVNADLSGYLGPTQYWGTIGTRIGDPLLKHHPVMATVGPLYNGGRDFNVYWKRGF